MNDGGIYSVDIRLPKDIHQRSEVNTTGDEQPSLKESVLTVSGKQPIAIGVVLFYAGQCTAQGLAHQRGERSRQTVIEDLELDTRAAVRVDCDFQLRGRGGIGGFVLRKNSADGKAKTKDTY